MATSQTSSVSNAVLQSQLNDIVRRLGVIETAIIEVKKEVTDRTQYVSDFERSQAALHPLIDARLTAVELQTSEHDKQITKLTESVLELKQTVKIVTWVCGIAAGGIISWLIAQLLALI